MNLSYSLFVRGLGFYWDDWQAVYLERAGNIRLVWDFFTFDRPFSTWTFVVLFPVLGANPIAWQISTLLVRWLGVLCFVLTLSELFPEQVGWMRWAGLLMMVYPGFPLQSIAVAFSQHFITFLFFSLSLLFMVWYAQRGKTRYAWLALATCLVQIFTMEYFAALELIRPLLLWIIFAKTCGSWAQTTRKVVKVWWIFLIPLAGYAFFRFFLYTRWLKVDEVHPFALLTAFLQAPLKEFLHFTTTVLQDTLQMIVFNWVNILSPATINFDASSTLVSWVLGLLVAALCIWLVDVEWPANGANLPRTKLIQWGGLLAGMIIFLGTLPVWMIGRQVTQGKWSERFTLGAIPGIALLLVVAIVWLLHSKRKSQIILALILGFSIAAQVRTTNKYRLDWEIQRDYFWQLYWRAPNLAPQTAILSDGVSSYGSSNFSVGFGINSLYHQSPITDKMAFWFFTPKSDDAYMISPLPDFPITYRLRNMTFAGSTAHSLGVSYAPAVGCVRIVTPENMDDPVLRDAAGLARLSNLEQIQTDPPIVPDTAVFGEEPAHTWCYYYEKADLALQEKNWAEVIRLMDEAKQKGYAPQAGGELLPLMDAYAQTGDWEQVYQTSLQAQNLTIQLEPMICAAWARYKTLPGASDQTDVFAQSALTFKCAEGEP